MAYVPKAVWLIVLAVGVSHGLRDERPVRIAAAPARAAVQQVTPCEQPVPAAAAEPARIGPVAALR